MSVSNVADQQDHKEEFFTSNALDEDTERGVMKVVEGLKGEMTILIITHRISTLACCDKIYKVHQGKLEEQKRN